VRRDPTISAAIITALPDATVVQLTGREAEADGFAWAEVVVPSGQVGWIAKAFLVPYQQFQAP
jgi:hypothetical protein